METQAYSPPSTRHFASLDALRGIACVLVAIYHMTGMRWQFGGHLLLDFFLVLSGFVLAHSYLYREKPIASYEFVVRRFARLWPLHVFALFFTFGVVSYGLNRIFFTPADSNYHNNWTTLIENLTMTHNIGLPPNGKYVSSWVHPSWSISVEFWVNMLFILLTTVRTPSWKYLVLSLVCLGLIFQQSGTLATFNENYFGVLNSGLLRGLASFFLGIVSYRLFLRFHRKSLPRPIWTGLELGSLLAYYFFLFASVRGLTKWEFLAPYFFVFMIALYAMEQGWISRGIRCLEYLGTISYSIYLNHLAIQLVMGNRHVTAVVPAKWNIPIGILIVIVLSHFTYQYVERPSQRFLLRKLLPKRPAPLAVPGSET